jgi:hypothetical protein
MNIAMKDVELPVVVGDTIEVNGRTYAVIAINEDGIVVKELK